MPVTNYYSVNGEIIAEHTAGQSRLDYVPDGLGSVVATVDQTLTVQSTARYKPYGAVLSSTGAQPRFGWVGSQGYRNTGLHYSEIYVRARGYSTTDGRWSTADLLWPAQTAYRYAVSSPVTECDPTGLDPCPAWIYEAQAACLASLPLTPASLSAVNACIANANKVLGSKCLPLTPTNIHCLQKAGRNKNILECEFHKLTCGNSPNAPGTVQGGPIPSGGVKNPVGPIRLNPNLCHLYRNRYNKMIDICPPNVGTGGFPSNGPFGSATGTICHESLHTCGYNHTTSGGSPPSGVPECNEVAVCCIGSVSRGLKKGDCTKFFPPP